ncbi:hypothetical protein TNCV_3482341 [Trichonephila clavipes]|nr:hypothetical protein TNCV_3482341 [Trichonephila clavipes]
MDGGLKTRDRANCKGQSALPVCVVVPSCRPPRELLLNARLQAARLSWAREHRYWSVEDWERSSMETESRFRQLTGDWRLRI